MVLLVFVAASPASAQVRYDPEAMVTAQREAMRALSFMDGAWRGTAWVLEAGGRQRLVQTERVGLLLGGAVRLVEGRGYGSDGSTRFNALGIISFNPATRNYSIRAYAMGHSGDFPLRLLPNGYVWEAPAGPGATVRYTATFDGGVWHEVGERVGGTAAPVRVLEMRLRRIGATSWPTGGAVPRR
jgi:hypothetical protein